MLTIDDDNERAENAINSDSQAHAETDQLLDTQSHSPTKPQSSLVTIFSVWNTMLGTSLVSLPWGFGNAGIILGILVVFFVAVISWYTGYLVLRNGMNKSDFRYACRHYLGTVGDYLAQIGSIITFFGVTIIYSILFSTNLLNLIKGIVLNVNPSFNEEWYLNSYSVSIYVAIALLPLLNLKNMSFIIRMNSIGIFCVLYLIVFIVTTSFVIYDDEAERDLFSNHFYYLAGMLSLSFFVHNFVLTVSQKSNPKHIVRDFTLGFSGGTLSYVAIGVIGYSAVGKNVLDFQNFIDVVSVTDIFGITGKVAVVLQMTTLFPLISGLLRTQLSQLVLQKEFPGRPITFAYSLVILTVGALFGMFYPQVGDVLRVTGSICGFLYVYCLPVAVHVMRTRSENKASVPFYVLHGTIIAIGLAIIVSQFL